MQNKHYEKVNNSSYEIDTYIFQKNTIVYVFETNKQKFSEGPLFNSRNQ